MAQTFRINDIMVTSGALCKTEMHVSQIFPILWSMQGARICSELSKIVWHMYVWRTLEFWSSEVQTTSKDWRAFKINVHVHNVISFKYKPRILDNQRAGESNTLHLISVDYLTLTSEQPLQFLLTSICCSLKSFHIFLLDGFQRGGLNIVDQIVDQIVSSSTMSSTESRALSCKK